MIYTLRRLQDPFLVVKFQNFFGAYLATNNVKSKSNENSSILNLQDREKSPIYDSNKGKIVDTSWSTFILSDGTVGSSNEFESLSSNNSRTPHIITNWFWFYFFSLATLTGDEIFYITFFPFWKWNVDGAVFRQVIYLWLIAMYVGQALKDLLKVPRPSCPPVACLDTKWQLEYGLPSTHAIVAYVMPFSLVFLSISRYQLNEILCFSFALFWCVSVCLSRIYLGMHSILDILSGVILGIVLLFLSLPLITSFDYFMLTHPLSPIISITLSIAMVICYPSSDKWSSARGDTTVIVGVGCGCLVGSWLNYQLGFISEPDFKPPFTVVWPTLAMCCSTLLRTTLGLFILVGVRTIFKLISLRAICHILQVSVSDYKYKPSKVPSGLRLIVELFYKFITYTSIGFTIVFPVPLLFKFFSIERPMFYTEM